GGGAPAPPEPEPARRRYPLLCNDPTARGLCAMGQRPAPSRLAGMTAVTSAVGTSRQYQWAQGMTAYDCTAEVSWSFDHRPADLHQPGRPEPPEFPQI